MNLSDGRHFAPLYPIIHRSTLGHRRITPELLLAIILLGTAFAEGRSGIEAASTLLKRVRNRVLEVSLQHSLLMPACGRRAKSYNKRYSNPLTRESAVSVILLAQAA